SDRDGDALHLALRIAAGPVVALIDDRIHGDGGLSRLAVADDQLPLASADRGHGVDGLDPGLQWFLHRLAVHHRRRLDLEDAGLVISDLALPVDRLAQGVDHTAEHAVADRN